MRSSRQLGARSLIITLRCTQRRLYVGVFFCARCARAPIGSISGGGGSSNDGDESRASRSRSLLSTAAAAAAVVTAAAAINSFSNHRTVNERARVFTVRRARVENEAARRRRRKINAIYKNLWAKIKFLRARALARSRSPRLKPRLVSQPASSSPRRALILFPRQFGVGWLRGEATRAIIGGSSGSSGGGSSEHLIFFCIRAYGRALLSLLCISNARDADRRR